MKNILLLCLVLLSGIVNGQLVINEGSNNNIEKQKNKETLGISFHRLDKEFDIINLRRLQKINLADSVSEIYMP